MGKKGPHHRRGKRRLRIISEQLYFFITAHEEEFEYELRAGGFASS